jgi:hypothetical protein
MTLARVAVGCAGALLVVLMLGEFFATFLVPHRVKRDPRVVRRALRIAWRPWRFAARRLPAGSRETALGLYGPFLLMGVLLAWGAGLVVGFACVAWGVHAEFGAGHMGFGDYLYDAAARLVSAADSPARTTIARLLAIGEAASGLVVLFISIGYLPLVYQAYSRRETAISQLDPRAGSPPTAATLVRRSTARGGWQSLDAYLGEWEAWAAELMETHLSYPVLAYFRSQHMNQDWFAALVTVMDASALVIAAADDPDIEGARFTFALGRHALADLAFTFRARERAPDAERLGSDELASLVEELAAAGLSIREQASLPDRLTSLRAMYEPYAHALSESLELPMPQWLAPEHAQANWHAASWRGRGRGGNVMH